MSSSATDRIPAVIIGGGVVGCALAEALFRLKGIPAWVLESGPRIAEGTTSRNSGVIHAGIYYKPGSLKADCCIRGKALLYEWCGRHGVAHRRTGKWIVGAADEQSELEGIWKNARDSGATGIRLATLDELRNGLPGVRAEIGLYSEETGIVDPYEFSCSLKEAAEEGGAEFLMDTTIQGIERLADGGFKLFTTRGEIEAAVVFNSAGLHADEISGMAGLPAKKIYPWRGDYFRLSSRFRFRELIYPVKKKNDPGLGIHLTVGLDGTCKLGPDVEIVTSKTDFSSREEKRDLFFKAASKYLLDLKPEDLYYDTCGIRPKLRAPTDLAELDFVIEQPSSGFIHLLGIESPGLTSSMAIAERAVAML